MTFRPKISALFCLETLHTAGNYLFRVSAVSFYKSLCVFCTYRDALLMFLEHLYNLGLLHNKTTSKGEPENIIL